ncbi:hypothetical protein TorRG33x02_353900, partial [Trema orientale]
DPEAFAGRFRLQVSSNRCYGRKPQTLSHRRRQTHQVKDRTVTGLGAIENRDCFLAKARL